MPRAIVTVDQSVFLSDHDRERLHYAIERAIQATWRPFAFVELYVEQVEMVGPHEQMSVEIKHSIAWREVLRYFWRRKRYAAAIEHELERLPVDGMVQSWNVWLRPQWGTVIAVHEEPGGLIESDHRNVETPYLYLDQISGPCRIVGDPKLYIGIDGPGEQRGCYFLCFLLEHRGQRTQLRFKVSPPVRLLNGSWVTSHDRYFLRESQEGGYELEIHTQAGDAYQKEPVLALPRCRRIA